MSQTRTVRATMEISCIRLTERSGSAHTVSSHPHDQRAYPGIPVRRAGAETGPSLAARRTGGSLRAPGPRHLPRAILRRWRHQGGTAGECDVRPPAGVDCVPGDRGAPSADCTRGPPSRWPDVGGTLCAVSAKRPGSPDSARVRRLRRSHAACAAGRHLSAGLCNRARHDPIGAVCARRRLHDCRLQITAFRPRSVCSRTDIEPDNDHTDTPATMSIDGLFYLSFTTKSYSAPRAPSERTPGTIPVTADR